jgi:ABC-type multidrug transport system ATPase subunit
VSLLSVEEATKSFAGSTVLERVSLRLEPGDRFCLLGRNGAGKSTLLRMIVGMYLPDAGRVLLHGKDPAGYPRARRAVGFASDKPFLYDKLSCREHFVLHAALYGLEARVATHRGMALLEQMDMARSANQRAETFSFGMRKKLSLVLALLHAPSLLVLDEPLAGLDPETAVEVETLLREYSVSAGTVTHIPRSPAGEPGTVLLSTHSIAFASDFATRQGIMRGGHLSVESLGGPAASEAGGEGGA